MSHSPSEQRPSNHLVHEATACAKHLDEEGMGYSADVMRRTMVEIERLRGNPLCPHGMPLAENICGPCSEGRPNRASHEPCPTHTAEHRLRDTLPCPWCVIDELKRNRDSAALPPSDARWDVNYQPALVFAVRELLSSLPKSRDWFNPDAERVFREFLSDARQR